MARDRTRKVFHQFEFAPLEGVDGVLRFERIGVRDIAVQRPDPDWVSISASGFRGASRHIDHKEKNIPEHLLEEDAYLQTRHQLAGIALHAISEHLQLWDALPTDAATSKAAQDTYKDHLDHRLPRLLPTTAPRDVRKIRRRLDDPRLALTRVERTPEAIRTCHEIIAQAVLTDLSDRPPLIGTEPLHLGDLPRELPHFLKPSVLKESWGKYTMPWLRANVGLLLRHHEKNPGKLGKLLSRPKEGLIEDLPELRVLIVAPGLSFTLYERADRLTREPAGSGTTVEVVDLKAGRLVRGLPEGSHEETAEQAITYLTAVALAGSAPTQEKDGYALEFRTDTGPENPRTIGPFDSIDMPVVAIGKNPPDIVNRAEQYGALFTDPNAACELLVRTRGLLDRIREDSRSRKTPRYPVRP